MTNSSSNCNGKHPKVAHHAPVNVHTPEGHEVYSPSASTTPVSNYGPKVGPVQGSQVPQDGSPANTTPEDID